MSKKIAEITIKMDCGGYIKTYIPCKGIKDLRKKLDKRRVGDGFNFGHFTVDDNHVYSATFNLHEVN